LQNKGLTEGVKELVTNEIYCALAEMTGVCKFVYGLWSGTRDITDIKHRTIPKLYTAATGINTDWDQMRTAAERVLNLERCFNIGQGMTKADDEFPRRFLEDPIPDGSFKGEVYDISEEFYGEYCKQVGWDSKTGFPEKGKLDQLGIGFALRDPD
jgi:aldehyde:ferredoxin oxidoreductase